MKTIILSFCALAITSSAFAVSPIFGGSGNFAAAPSEQTVGDANVTWASGKSVLRATSAMTANRVVTLPAAAAFVGATRILFVDKVTDPASAFIHTFSAAGSDTVNGGSSYAPFAGPGAVELETDGVSAWAPVHDTLNIVSFRDGIDPSKQLQFDLSAITTLTTRTVTALDSNVTLGSVYTLATTLTGDTTINNQQTPTTGGVTLTATLASGSTWKIEAFGDYTSANSATARNFEITPFWNTTALPKAACTVKTSQASTVGWSATFLIRATSTTAAWTTGLGKMGPSTAGINIFYTATSATTGSLTSGSTTLDLRFDTSASVVGDSIIVKQVIMERLK